MKSTLVRSFIWAGFCLTIGLSGCAQGAPAAPAEEIPPPAAAPMGPTCGNGKLDMGELCDCPVGATGKCEITPAATCDMLMNGYTGTLLCDAKTCTYNMDLCTGPTGTGAAGTGK